MEMPESNIETPQFNIADLDVPMPPSKEERMQQELAEQQSHIPEDNPFNVEKYQNVSVPDVPVNYGGGMAEQLLHDNDVPDTYKREWWWVFKNDNTLTFLDEARKAAKLLTFDIAKTDMLNAIPYYDYDFEKELEFTVLRNVFETKLDRALGFKTANMKNERIMLQSQFSEQRQISETGTMGGNIKEGFFKRLLGRR